MLTLVRRLPTVALPLFGHQRCPDCPLRARLQICPNRILIILVDLNLFQDLATAKNIVISTNA